METSKLRVKVGPHEFEAEGTPESVSSQFEIWKSLINSAAAGSSAKDTVSSNPAPKEERDAKQDGAGVSDQLARLFAHDEKRGLITLLVPPRGEGRFADGLLQVVYGYRQLLGEDETLVTWLKASLEASGTAPDRIDRVAQPLVDAGLLLKRGVGKGGKYRLTTKGVTRVESMIAETLAQIA